jgi:hypothetical protein
MMTNCRIHLLFPSLILALGATLVAASPSPLTGIWDCEAIRPDGSPLSTKVEFFEQKDGHLVHVTIEGVRSIATSVRTSGESFSFTVMYQSLDFSVAGKVDGDTLEGQYSRGAGSGSLRGTRRLPREHRSGESANKAGPRGVD